MTKLQLADDLDQSSDKSASSSEALLLDHYEPANSRPSRQPVMSSAWADNMKGQSVRIPVRRQDADIATVQAAPSAPGQMAGHRQQ